jgi:hypothetical protein
MASALKLDTIKSLAGNDAMTISEGGVATFNNPFVQVIPILSVTRSTNQTSGASGAETLFQPNTATIDNKNWWDFTNHRYIPQIAGWYTTMYNGTAIASTNTIALCIAYVAKNGTAVHQLFIRSAATTSLMATAMGLVYCNGSTDYIDFRFRNYAATGTFIGTGEIYLIQRDPV